MSSVLEWFGQDMWSTLVTALAHSLWQGLIIAVILAAALRALSAGRTTWRYGLSLAALGLLVSATALTWAGLEYRARQSPAPTQTQMGIQSDAAPVFEKTAVQTIPPESIHSERASSPKTVPKAFSSPDVPTPWRSGLALTWVIGVIFMLAESTWRLTGVGQLRRACQPVMDAEFRARVTGVQKRLGIARNIEILLCDRIVTPVVIGVLRPALLVTVAMVTGDSTDRIEAALAHELAHIRRHDYLVNLGQVVIESLLFFNPFVWLISRQIRIEREACCDAVAARAMGESGIGYARLLSEAIEEFLTIHPAPLAQGLAGESGGGFVERIRRLASPGHRPRMRLNSLGLIGLFLGTALALTTLWVGSKVAVETTAALFMTPQQLKQIAEAEVKYGGSRNWNDENTTPSVTLSGAVQTYDGKPLPEFIQLVIQQGNSSSHISIDAKRGLFSRKIQPGRFRMAVVVDGYSPALSPYYQPQAGDTIKDIYLVLPPLRTARIRLVTPEGKPITSGTLEAMSLMVDEDGSGWSGLGSETYEPDGEGWVAVSNVGDLPMKLTATAAGYEQEEKIKITLTDGQEMDCELSPATPIRGTVVSRESGLPIAGAKIRIRERERPGHSHGYGIGWETFDSMTDEQGRFALSSVSSDWTYTIQIAAEGYGRQFVGNLNAGDDVRIELGPVIHVRGQVTGDLNLLTKHRKGFMLSYDVYVRKDYQGTNLQADYGTLYLSDDGHFEILDLPEGDLSINTKLSQHRYDITESMGDLVIDLSKEAQELPKTERLVVLRLLVPEGGHPAGGTLGVRRYHPQGYFQMPTAVPIENNEARITVGAPTKISLEIDGLRGYVPIVNNRTIEVTDEPTTLTIDLPVLPAGAIFGQVLNADGTPAQGCSLSLCTVKRPESVEFLAFLAPEVESGNGTDGPNGFYAGPLAYGGIYSIRAARGTEIAHTEEIEIGPRQPLKEVNIQFGRCVPITGVVTDLDGAPISKTEVRLSYSAPGLSQTLPYTQTNQDGRFEFARVNPDLPGEYSVRTHPQEGYQAGYQEIKQWGKPIQFKLKPGLSFEGVVLDDETGWPIPGVEVRFWQYNTSGQKGGGQESRTLTDQQGKFRLTNLAPGEASLYWSDVELVQPSDPKILIAAENPPGIFRVRIRENSQLKPKEPTDD